MPTKGANISGYLAEDSAESCCLNSRRQEMFDDSHFGCLLNMLSESSNGDGSINVEVEW